MAGLARRPTVLIVLHQEHSTPGVSAGRCARWARGSTSAVRASTSRCRKRFAATTAPSFSAARWGPTMRTTGSSARSTGSRSRSPSRSLSLASASGRRFWRARSAPGSSPTRTSAAKSDTFPISPTAAADRLCEKPFPRCAYQWHADGFDLPEGAELLAIGGADFPNQAFRYGKAVGLQFHPEVTYHMMCRWTIRGAERLTRPGAQSRPLHLGGWYQHDAVSPHGSRPSCPPGWKGGWESRPSHRARR